MKWFQGKLWLIILILLSATQSSSQSGEKPTDLFVGLLENVVAMTISITKTMAMEISKGITSKKEEDKKDFGPYRKRWAKLVQDNGFKDENEVYNYLFVHVHEEMEGLKSEISESIGEIRAVDAKVDELNFALENWKSELAYLASNESNNVGLISPPDWPANNASHGWISSTKPESRLLLGSVISNPKARIFYKTDENEESFYCNSDRSPTPQCEEINPRFQKAGRTIETFHTCVRLFQHANCQGYSRAYYPKFSMNVLEKTMPSKSIGPCFQNELDESLWKISPATGEKEFRKMAVKIIDSSNRQFYVPDEVDFGTPAQTPTTAQSSSSSSSRPIVYYGTGEGGRVNYLLASVTSQAIRQSCPAPALSKTDLSPELRYHYLHLDRNEGDSPGYFIGPLFCPQSDLSHINLFPQSPWNNYTLTQLERDIISFLIQNPGKWVDIYIKMIYPPKDRGQENVQMIKTKTRPMGLIYRIQFYSSPSYDYSQTTRTSYFYLHN